MRFKVGDRVRLNYRSWDNDLYNKKGIVVEEVESCFGLYRVKLNDHDRIRLFLAEELNIDNREEKLRRILG